MQTFIAANFSCFVEMLAKNSDFQMYMDMINWNKVFSKDYALSFKISGQIYFAINLNATPNLNREGKCSIMFKYKK